MRWRLRRLRRLRRGLKVVAAAPATDHRASERFSRIEAKDLFLLKARHSWLVRRRVQSSTICADVCGMTTMGAAETRRPPLNMRMIISGLVFVLLGVIAGARQHRTGTWPTTTGEIQQSIRGGLRLFGWHTFTVTYSFSVDGKKFTVIEPLFARSSAQKRAVPAGLPLPGETWPITVAYNPQKPAEATIEAGLKTWPFVAGGLGVLLVVVALVMKLFPRAAGEEELPAGSVAPY
jgi:hypothetical protein